MRVVVSTDSGAPIYLQIYRQMRLAILSGELEAGETLPSLRKLSAELRVSLITATRAYNDLVAEGLVLNEHGRGFVVLDIDQDAARFALDEQINAALLALRDAAKHAGLPLEAIHRRIDETWRADD